MVFAYLQFKKDTGQEMVDVFASSNVAVEDGAVEDGELTTFTTNNYFGVGVDGAVSLGFHRMRQRAPGLFFNRWVNKLWYGTTPHPTSQRTAPPSTRPPPPTPFLRRAAPRSDQGRSPAGHAAGPGAAPAAQEHALAADAAGRRAFAGSVWPRHGDRDAANGGRGDRTVSAAASVRHQFIYA